MDALLQPPHELARVPLPAGPDPLASEDLQLALYLGYELHYRGFHRVDDALEWDPFLLGIRAALEQAFEAALRTEMNTEPIDPDDVPARLRELAEGGPSAVASFLGRKAERWHYEEFMIHRSAYHLKEADPHSWAIPRIAGPAKAALVEIQADEYGGGDVEWMHAELFGRTMERLGLDRTYGAYVDRIPAVTLATVNLMSFFGLHRRLRGSAVGHLAAFELGSARPNRLYGDGLRRLGLGEDVTLFFDEHVEADSVHENVAGGRPRRRAGPARARTGRRHRLGRSRAGRDRGPLGRLSDGVLDAGTPVPADAATRRRLNRREAPRGSAP